MSRPRSNGGAASRHSVSGSSLLARAGANLLREASGETLIAAKTGEESERPMLERVQDAPAHTFALRASDTVMAREVEAAIDAVLGQSEAATGLVMILAPDFEGYFAELARGLASAALGHKSLVKLAVVTDPERMDEARGSDFEASPVPIRLFARADEKGALEWAAAARRGE